jgi:hypothetical protein
MNQGSSLPRATLLPVGVLAISLFGCGGAQPPPQEPAPAASAPAPLTVAMNAPGMAKPDLSLAAEPEHLVALGRWKSPSKSFDVVSKWTGFPVSAAVILKLMGEPGLAPLLADDAPVDAAVVLDPGNADADFSPFAAFSIGVRSLDDARQAAERKQRVTETAPGIFRIGSLKHADTDNMTCYLAAALGSAPARLVCGEGERDIAALLPYMTRKLPTEDLGPADVHTELRLKPAQKLYGPTLAVLLRNGAAVAPSRLEIGETTFDRALGRAASGLAEELDLLSNDADSLSIDLTLGAAETEILVRAKLKSQRSWTAGTLAGLQAAQAAAPEGFWALPADATSASFAQASDPKRCTEIVAILRDLLDGFLAHEGIATADRARVTGLLAAARMVAPSTVSAVGPNGPPPKNAPAVPKGHPFAQTWHLWGIGETDKTMQELKDATVAINLPKMKSLIEKKIQKPLDLSVLSVKSVAPPAGLSKGSLDIEVTVAKALSDVGAEKPSAKGPKGKTKPVAKDAPRYTAHLIAMPEAAMTWLALGIDRESMKRVLLSVKNAHAGASALSTRPGLEGFRTEKLASGGYFTLKGFVDQIPKDMDRASELAQVSRLLETSPNRGATPMTMAISVSQAGALTLTGSLRIPKSAIEDLTVVASGMAMRHGRP